MKEERVDLWPSASWMISSAERLCPSAASAAAALVGYMGMLCADGNRDSMALAQQLELVAADPDRILDLISRNHDDGLPLKRPDS